MTGISADQIWDWCAQALGHAMPSRNADIQAALGRIDLNTEPDLEKYPHAFTLHDSGAGRPYVSVPYGGSARDILTLAHEFGHAIQILHTDAAFTPPVLREVCAFLSESWLIDYVASFDKRLGADICVPWRRSVAVDFGSRRDALLAACAAPQTPYEYAWNYPLARRLAVEAAKNLTETEHWQLFCADYDVAALAAKAGL